MLFITSDYKGCEAQHKKAGIRNVAVNLTHVVTFDIGAGDTIVFRMSKGEDITWRYINDAIRDADYNRIYDLVTDLSKASFAERQN